MTQPKRFSKFKHASRASSVTFFYHPTYDLVDERQISQQLYRMVPPSYTHTPKSLQCLRLTAIPNQNARHDPCPGTDLAKPLSPLETLALTSLDQTIMVLFVFDRIPSERRFPTGLFSWALLTPTNKNAKQALFLVCILQDGF